MSSHTPQRFKFGFMIIIIECCIAALPILYYLYIYADLPSIVAVHYDILGHADDFASKDSNTVQFFTLIGYMGLLTGLCLRALGYWYEKRHGSRGALKIAIISAEFFMVVLFTTLAFLILCGMAYSLSPDMPFMIRIMMIVSSVFIIFFGNLMPKLRRNHLAGIRTLYSLSSDDAWQKVHRFGGKVFVVSGIIALLISILPFISDITAVIINLSIFIAMFAASVFWKPYQAKNTNGN